jgi:hypothetical protein
MKRICFLLVSMLTVASAFAQTNELGAGAGTSSTSNLGLQSTVATGTLLGQVAVGSLDLGGSVSISSLHKVGTPGGHQFTYSTFARKWIQSKAFMTGTVSWARSDATLWIKNTTFLGAAGGLRWRNARSNHSRPDEDLAYLSYEQEVQTTAMYPNRTRIYSAGLRHDFHLAGRKFFRLNLAAGRARFIQLSEVWHGVIFTTRFSLVFKADDHSSSK